MASTIQWTWTWENSGRWWGAGRPCVRQSMGSKTVRHEWATTRFTLGLSKENGWLTLKISNLCDGLQGRVFKGKIARGRAVGCVTFFWLLGRKRGCSRNLSYQPSCSKQPGVHILVLSLSLPFSTLVGAQVLQKLYIRLLCTSPKEEPAPCPMLHDCLLTAFPLFLHSHTCLFTNCLNLSFGTQGRSGRLKSFSSK